MNRIMARTAKVGDRYCERVPHSLVSCCHSLALCGDELVSPRGQKAARIADYFKSLAQWVA